MLTLSGRISRHRYAVLIATTYALRAGVVGLVLYALWVAPRVTVEGRPLLIAILVVAPVLLALSLWTSMSAVMRRCRALGWSPGALAMVHVLYWLVIVLLALAPLRLAGVELPHAGMEVEALKALAGALVVLELVVAFRTRPTR